MFNGKTHYKWSDFNSYLNELSELSQLSKNRYLILLDLSIYETPTMAMSIGKLLTKLWTMIGSNGSILRPTVLQMGMSENGVYPQL